MSMQAARAFHERVLTDASFRHDVEASGDDTLGFVRARGYRFEAEEWDRLQEDLAGEAHAARQIVRRLESGDESGALEEARRSLSRWQLSWQLLDVYAAVLARTGRRAEAVALLADLTPSHPRVAYLDASQQCRVLDILSTSIAFALRPAPVCAGASRAEHCAGPVGREQGGWSMRVVPGTWPARHQVDCRRDLTVPDFVREFAFRNTPVVIGGSIDQWPAWHRWRRDALVETHGGAIVEVHPSRHVVENLRQERPPERLPLADYIDRMTVDPPATYLFKGLPAASIADDFAEPSYFGGDVFSNDARLRQARTFFYLGGPGSGVGFHQHVAAWNAVVFGYKRWFLLPPHAIHRYRTIDVAELVRTNHVGPDVIEFVQLPGEVVFVPQYWHHATYNLTECIGVAREVGVVPDLGARLRASHADA